MDIRHAIESGDEKSLGALLRRGDGFQYLN